MGRLTQIFALIGLTFLVGAGCSSKGGGKSGVGRLEVQGNNQVVQGLITAQNVDVIGDDGSMLADRLNIGDVVFIVTNPQGGNRAGYARISRSGDDPIGIGWVNVGSVRMMPTSSYVTGGSSSSPPPVDVPPVQNDPVAPEPNQGGDPLFGEEDFGSGDSFGDLPAEGGQPVEEDNLDDLFGDDF